MHNVIKMVVVFFVVLLMSCGGSSSSDKVTTEVTDTDSDLSYLYSPPSSIRTWLTYEELKSLNLSKNSAYHNSYFMPVGETSAAIHEINDTLTITSGKLSNFPSQFDDNLQANIFPNISFHVFSYKGYLVPSNREIIIPSGQSKQWRVILSPGKTWSEPNDNGMSRASFPFVLVDSSWNDTLNGIATFLYDQNTVSNMRLQIVQQTSSGFSHEGAATLPLARDNIESSALGELMQEFNDELSHLLPTKPWSELEQSYPNIDFDKYNDNLKSTDISASGIWHNNTLYMQKCNTLYGEYPYCQFMRHGIFSATKSSVGAVALAFLTQRYGEEVLHYKVVNYIDFNSSHNGWDNVTFIDLLNMAAGIGNHDQDPLSTNYHADENMEPMGDWSRAKSALNKITITTEQYGNFPWEPGEVFRYNTTHSFMLSAAMDSLVRQREKIGLWQLLLTEVYQPIGIYHLPMMHTTESGNENALPINGIGLYPTADEAIKIGKLLHNEGLYNGKQILHAGFTRNMLYRTNELGFNVVHENNQYGKGKYHRSFWGTPFEQNGCFAHTPFMNGYGGNLMGILPNGVITLRFADAQNYRTIPMVEIASQLVSYCKNN
jgi:hypothetical protein